MPYLNIKKLFDAIEARNKRLEEERIKQEEEILSKMTSEPVILNMGNIEAIPDFTCTDFSSLFKDDGNKAKGTRYELYIGSLYEKKGYTVAYNGIEKGNRDGGIDLICKNGLLTELVQCKCYTRCNVTQKDICYFYGVVRLYAGDHIQEVVKGAYWTTRKITQKQQVFRVINKLGITLYDGVMMPSPKLS